MGLSRTTGISQAESAAVSRTSTTEARGAAIENFGRGFSQARIGAGALGDQSLREARIRERFGVTIVAVNRADGIILNPPPETILRPGDTVRAFGLPHQIAAFVREAEGSSSP